MRDMLFVGILLAAVGCSSSSKKVEAESQTAASNAKAATEKVVAKATKAASEGTVTCASKEDSRILELRAKDKGCELAYTKAGKETIVATSNSGSAHCAKVQNRIQENLKGAGFNCQ